MFPVKIINHHAKAKLLKRIETFTKFKIGFKPCS